MKAGYNEIIEIIYKEICKMTRNREWEKDCEKTISLLKIIKEALYNQIYSVLSAIKNDNNEKKIRELIGKYIIGGKDSKGKVWLSLLSMTKALIDRQTSSKKKNLEEIQTLLELYDDFMAMASLRSFKHFCLYMETDFPKKIWQPTQHLFDGWFYYATKMVIDGDVKFIEKQLPTGFGKSISDCFLIAFIFGQDINNDVLKVFGNKYNCSRAFDTIVNLMCSKQFAKAFPYYAQFECQSDKMFEKCKQKDGEFKITGSHQPVNFLCVGKDSKVNGVRAKYLFLDDITQAEDKDNIRMHDKDVYLYEQVWFKRSYSNNNFYIIVGGTTYNIYDLLSYLKLKFGYSDSTVSKVNKFTKTARSNEIVKNGISVFISVPKLDLETDESVYPEEFPTEKARAQRAEDYETFMAMEQQMPLAPKNNPYYYTYLKEYDDVPEEGTFGRGETCLAYCDTKRHGKDYCAMVIGTKIANGSTEEHFIIDGIYDNRPMKEQYNAIVSKIILHNITILNIENNINEGITNILREMLVSRGYLGCQINEVFNNQNKEDRIMDMEHEIKNYMRFPRRGMFPRSSPVGMAMDELYSFSYVKKNVHDDWTDACAGYAKCFIANKYGKLKKAKLIRL